MSSVDSVMNFNDADLRASMRRAILTTVALGAAGFVVLAIAMGWQTGALFAAGAAVSATGLYEWRQLIGVINARLDNEKTPRFSGFVLAMFFLRMGFAVLVIYASLRFLDGTFYALLAGLGLAILALMVEVLRMLRS
jgi:hypothetical protein